ncbi:F0F1 ATP synthase subunit delta [Candidatus Puniceispirillum sp.]|nr:F0F1 ATP synthase subunit delta [Candidatus Puniceispirillum sp.]
MSSGATGLAGRYAGALYALASQSTKVDVIHDELGRLSDLIDESRDLRMLLESPILTRDEQQRGITTIMEKASADVLTVKFLGTLASNGRLSALPRIIQAFQQEHARQCGQVNAEVISAIVLDASRKAVVERVVARLAGSENLLLSMRVDPSLIGGLVVRIGSRMIDTSIKTKLSRLESAMKGVA